MEAVFVLLCCSWTVKLWSFVQAYENLALKKPAFQSSILYYYEAARAVDGQKTNLSWDGGHCAASEAGRTTVEWRVDLGRVLSIHHIFIQFRTDNRVWDKDSFGSKYFLGLFVDKDNHVTQFVLGFSVYLSNTTNKDIGVLCFRDTAYTRATIPNPVNITCRHHGRYVIYYNNRTHPPFPDGYHYYVYAELCEVEVYGCPTPGRYGENCSLHCPENCDCDDVTHTCLGCVPGYKGPECYDECLEGFYGYNCVENCSMTCRDPGKCDRKTGHCNGGCQAGWTGDMCGIECEEGLYGYNCEENCSMTCRDPGKCDRLTGHCEECQAGWLGPMCENECLEGFYGYNCVDNCSMTCGDPGRCDRKTGHCIGGCQDGWTGRMCEKARCTGTLLPERN